MDKSSVAQYYA